jgi:hypothetical protein
MTRTFGVICAKPNKEDQMKKSILLTLVIVVPLVSACCGIPNIGDLIPPVGGAILGSGNVVTQDFDITGFDKVDVSHAFTVDITQGDTFSVVVSIDDNLVEYLQVIKEGNTLRIGLDRGRNYSNMHATAEVTMPELTGLELSGATHGTVTGFSSAKALNVDVSGASGLTGDIEAGDAWFDVSGASDVTLSGSAQNVTIDASGASHVDLGDFPVGDASVEASGASNVTVNPSGRLDADASGASHVRYLGNPTLGTIESSGGSSIEGR